MANPAHPSELIDFGDDVSEEVVRSYDLENAIRPGSGLHEMAAAIIAQFRYTRKQLKIATAMMEISIKRVGEIHTDVLQQLGANHNRFYLHVKTLPATDKNLSWTTLIGKLDSTISEPEAHKLMDQIFESFQTSVAVDAHKIFNPLDKALRNLTKSGVLADGVDTLPQNFGDVLAQNEDRRDWSYAQARVLNNLGRKALRLLNVDLHRLVTTTEPVRQRLMHSEVLMSRLCPQWDFWQQGARDAFVQSLIHTALHDLNVADALSRGRYRDAWEDIAACVLSSTKQSLFLSLKRTENAAVVVRRMLEQFDKSPSEQELLLAQRREEAASQVRRSLVGKPAARMLGARHESEPRDGEEVRSVLGIAATVKMAGERCDEYTLEELQANNAELQATIDKLETKCNEIEVKSAEQIKTLRKTFEGNKYADVEDDGKVSWTMLENDVELIEEVQFEGDMSVWIEAMKGFIADMEERRSKYSSEKFVELTRSSIADLQQGVAGTQLMQLKGKELPSMYKASLEQHLNNMMETLNKVVPKKATGKRNSEGNAEPEREKKRAKHATTASSDQGDSSTPHKDRNQVETLQGTPETASGGTPSSNTKTPKRSRTGDGTAMISSAELAKGRSKAVNSGEEGGRGGGEGGRGGDGGGRARGRAKKHNLDQVENKTTRGSKGDCIQYDAYDDIA